MPKVSDEHKDEIRKRLLDAAEVCIARSGADGFTTRDVAREADVAAGTLYTYFASKEELIIAVAERGDERGLTRIIASLPPDDRSGRGFVAGLLLDVLGEIQPDDMFQVLRERAVRDAAVAKPLKRYNHYIVSGLAGLVEQAQTEGTLRADLDIEALIEVVACFFDGISSRVAADTTATSRARVARTFVQVLVRGAIAEDDVTRDLLEADLLERLDDKLYAKDRPPEGT